MVPRHPACDYHAKVPPYFQPLPDLEQVSREPLEQANLSNLSLKMALLVALTSIKRVGDLQAHSVTSECLEFGPAHTHTTTLFLCQRDVFSVVLSLLERKEHFPTAIQAGASGVLTDVFCSYGENVTLPCNNTYSYYNSTEWIYERNRDSRAVVLFADGIKKNNTERHDRLSLESDCSLNIYKVTKEDRGLYSCKQYKDGIRRLADGPSFSLHVLYGQHHSVFTFTETCFNFVSVSSPSTQTEIRPGSSVTLSCHLYSYDEYYCDPLVDIDGVQLVWVNHAGVNLQTYSRFQILHSGHCNSILTTTLLNEDNNTEWRCLATFKNEVKTSASYTVEYLGSSEPEEKHVFCSYGENVTLPCNNTLSDCTSTTWIYSRNRDSGTVVLYIGGIKKIDTERHNRRRLVSDCSLKIYQVTKDHKGVYSCQQNLNGQRQGNDANVFLHVLYVSLQSTQTVIRPGSSVTLSCHLYSYDEYYCDPLVDGVQLVWVNHAGVNLQTYSRFQILHSGHCNSTLTTTFLNEDNNTEWRCLATFRNEVKTSASYTVEYLGEKTDNSIH
ncbi:uncharacterized protein LOC127649022 [Xyrauchen texanus]|uniref:uncharacterized protein LOC127649022 n=1 Tax=Xyrauchen texanus TaxID=154827 RepID=UPI002241D108|nr:uncharacterized protein LOC127649022 [Xyrauchen texanus]